MEEIWKDVPNTAGKYQVSNTGKFKRSGYDKPYVTKHGSRYFVRKPEKELSTSKGILRYTDKDGFRHTKKLSIMLEELFPNEFKTSESDSRKGRNRGGANRRDRRTTLDGYKKNKKKILKELGIYLTYEENLHMDSLETENQVDNYARKLIMR